MICNIDLTILLLFGAPTFGDQSTDLGSSRYIFLLQNGVARPKIKSKKCTSNVLLMYGKKKGGKKNFPTHTDVVSVHNKRVPSFPPAKSGRCARFAHATPC